MSKTNDESLGSIILHHVTNDLNYKFLDLHLFGYDISITKHVIMLWIAAAITVSLAIYGTRRYRKNESAQPKGISHLYEILMNFIRNDIIIPNIGSKHGGLWTPLITTYFIFILTCNFIERIIDPLQSRCQTFKIIPPSKREVALHLREILYNSLNDYSNACYCLI